MGSKLNSEFFQDSNKFRYSNTLEKNKSINFFAISTKDKNLEHDPYFYERQKKLQRIRDDIESGKMPTHDFETSMDELIKELES